MGNDSISKKNEISFPEISVCLQVSYTQHLGFERNGEPSEWNDLDDKDPIGSSRLYEDIKSIAMNQSAEEKKDYKSFQRKGIHNYDGGIDTTFIETTMLIFSSVGGATAFFKFGKDIILKWMENASRRSVKLKVDDSEVEIKGSDDVNKAFQVFERLQKAKDQNKPKHIIISDK